MNATIRKLGLTAHVTASVGWLGAVIAYLALAVASLEDAELFRGLEVVGWRVIVPLAVATLVTGLVQSLGTEWKFFRFWWVAAKLGLATVGTTVLLIHLSGLDWSGGDLEAREHTILHAAGGVAILLAATVLSIYKPWGRIPDRFVPRLDGLRLAILAAVVLLLALFAIHLTGGGPHRH